MKELSQGELDKLFDKLFHTAAIISLPPVTKMKPSEIDELEGYDKIDYKIHFNKALLVYVKPLERLAKNLLDNANKEKYSYKVDDLSITERILLFKKILLHSGYTKEQIDSLLPKTEKDADLLAKAFENGYKEIGIMDNETRVKEARDFLQNLGIKPVNKKTIK